MVMPGVEVLSKEPTPVDVVHTSQDTELVLNPAVSGLPDSGARGCLYVCKNALQFYSSATSKGLLIPYPTISVHALVESGYIYAQLAISPDAKRRENGERGEEGDTESWDGTDIEPMVEMELRPIDLGELKMIYDKMCECATLHPDEGSEESADDDADQIVIEDTGGVIPGQFDDPHEDGFT